jgi:penicillin-binding protein 2
MLQEKFKSPRDAYENWAKYMYDFGLGKTLGIDVNNETPGIIKKPEYFDKIYGENSWKYSNIISLAIGQGELGITPVQMANIAAIIANRGFYYIPHTIRKVETGGKIPLLYTKKHTTKVSSYNYEVVVEAMAKVVLQGTAAGSKIKDIELCGKTGTVQNPHGENHSVFIAFAPKINPKIAIATVVENSGYGATWAAPIASLMIEKYIRRDSTDRKALEERILKANLIPENLK